nr:capsid assembly protein GP20-like protein [uncultured Mediterranean phage uvMED]
MAQLFGFSIDDSYKKPSKSVVSPVPQNNEDGADYYLASGFYGQYLDVEGVFKTEYDLIRRYREMALHPEVDSAIEDILCEAIVADQNDSPIQIDLENLKAGDKVKTIIREEFQYIKEMLDFDKKAHEIFRNWYVDGRIYYHKVIDLEKPEEGIKELRYIDALKIKYVREQKKKGGANAIQYTNNARPGLDGNPLDAEFPGLTEYFIYTPNSYQKNQYGSVAVSGQQKDAVKFAKDAIAYCTSGLVDRNKHTVLSYLQKAIKALNQLRMIEDSLVIYRMSRAPERRIFYIDVGNLPKAKAEQYLREVMSRYRNKLTYDASTGEVRDDKKYMSMMEDFWLPRREGGRGTEISTLPGGQNLGELTDVEYFQKKLFRSLNVPESRMADNSGFSLGRSSEILRDELKFTKFVGRMRKRFSNLFHDILKTQLVLKNVVTPEEWERMSDHIQYDFLYDNHFAELKDSELMQERLGLLATADPYIGKYYSVDYIRRKILRQTDDEIVEQDKMMDAEKKAGIILPTEQEMMLASAAEQATKGNLGKPSSEPDIDESSTEAPESPGVPKGGEI